MARVSFRNVDPNLAESNVTVTWKTCFDNWNRDFVQAAIDKFRSERQQDECSSKTKECNRNRGKKTNKRRPRITYTGDSSQMLPAPAHLNLSNFLSETQIQYRDLGKNCLPNAILNVAKNVKAKSAETFLKIHNENLSRGYSKFSLTTKTLSTNLEKIPKRDQSLAWILEQTSGCFLLEFSGHAVSIDCSRRLIFDCGYEYAYRMSLESFHELGITGVRYLARIGFPKWYRHS